MSKLIVDENYKIICPVDERIVNYGECVECCAFNGSDDDNAPEWIDCEESYRMKEQNDDENENRMV